jgi:hypothetical protein
MRLTRPLRSFRLRAIRTAAAERNSERNETVDSSELDCTRRLSPTGVV